MTWFRVEDTAEKKVVLVEAENAHQACEVYMRDFPPNLFAKEATPDEIAAWIKDPWPWPLD